MRYLDLGSPGLRVVVTAVGLFLLELAIGQRLIS